MMLYEVMGFRQWFDSGICTICRPVSGWSEEFRLQQRFPEFSVHEETAMVGKPPHDSTVGV